jgi:hypothetical protein
MHYDRTLWNRLPWHKDTLSGEDFLAAGYPFVDLPIPWWWPEWHTVHNWCTTEIGEGQYMHNGEIFWFLNTEDATRFALVWT